MQFRFLVPLMMKYLVTVKFLKLLNTWIICKLVDIFWYGQYLAVLSWKPQKLGLFKKPGYNEKNQ